MYLLTTNTNYYEIKFDKFDLFVGVHTVNIIIPINLILKEIVHKNEKFNSKENLKYDKRVVRDTFFICMFFYLLIYFLNLTD